MGRRSMYVGWEDGWMARKTLSLSEYPSSRSSRDLSSSCPCVKEEGRALCVVYPSSSRVTLVDCSVFVYSIFERIGGCWASERKIKKKKKMKETSKLIHTKKKEEEENPLGYIWKLSIYIYMPLSLPLFSVWKEIRLRTSHRDVFTYRGTSGISWGCEKQKWCHDWFYPPSI